MEILVDGEFHTYEEICNKVFGYYDKNAIQPLKIHKSRIKKKIDINFKVIKNQGMKILDDIYVE